MRWVVRLLAFILFLGGVGAGIVYPGTSSLTGREIGRWAVFERAGVFVPATVHLAVLPRPPLASLDVRLSAPLVVANGGALITLTGSIDGQTVIASAVDIADIKTRLVDPQSGELDATVDLGEVRNPLAGTYTFVAGPGDAEAEKLIRAELILSEGPAPQDSRVQSGGFVAMAVAFVVMVLSFRRGPPANPNSQPAPPKWGRQR